MKQLQQHEVSLQQTSFLEWIKWGVVAMRPRQWSKNLLLFAGLLFAEKLGDVDRVWLNVLAFLSFCLISGAVYIYNDLQDVEEDRLHPQKRLRPIASGKLPTVVASWFMLSAALAGLTLAFWIRAAFGWLALLYLLLSLGYSLGAKHIVILDVFLIAAGFVLRALAGAVAIDVTISGWLLACTTLLSLFLGFCKRRHELVTLGEEASNHRATLGEYSVGLLDQFIAIVSSATIITYALYTIQSATAMQHQNLKYTIPLVMYGIFRYLYLVHRKDLGGAPEQVLLEDRGIQATILLWIGVAIWAIMQ
ncbi:MAG: decaprenyl-phosphate phosphoribosyltransferase [Armatimonadota bacterium]|nr:decaprenyl-phosphate phosphoribosyltransferase [bacterium]MDW8320580.1 decaprenyl-phosphate phosphoribosyltransferase [Armatimonadota bacterium]